MLKVYVCEDIKVQRERMKSVIENIILMEDMDMEVVMVSSNPYDILETARNTEEVGIYFLDIDLQADINGLELAKEIRKYDPRGFIVFVTTHSEMSYMTFIYKLEAMDFILKDAQAEEVSKRVYECMLKANERFGSNNNRVQDVFTVKANDRKYSVEYDEIMFFETSTNVHKIILHCKNRVMEFYGKIKELESELDDRFYRCHRSFLVNKNNIREIDYEEKVIHMINGEECYMSSRLMKGLK